MKLWGKTAIAAAIASGLFCASADARADISAKTNVSYWRAGAQTGSTSTMLGSNVEGSFGDVFVDAVMIAKNVYDLIRSIGARDFWGAGNAVYDIYKNALAIEQDASDKISSLRGYLSLDPNGSYDQVKLDFVAWSNDDPFAWLRTAGPPMSGPTGSDPSAQKAGVFNPLQFAPASWNGQKTRVQTSATLYPQKLQPGLYPIVFSVKEDSCPLQCLSIAHTVMVSVAKSCQAPSSYACGTNCQRCAQWDRQFQALTTTLIGDYQTLRENTAIAYQRYGNIATKKRQACLGRVGGTGPYTPDMYSRCNAEVDQTIPQGACPDIGVYLTQNQCNQLRGSFDALKATLAGLANLTTQIQNGNCCHRWTNPNGTVLQGDPKPTF